MADQPEDDLRAMGGALVDVLIVARDPRLWHLFGVLVEEARIAARAREQLDGLAPEPHQDGASWENGPAPQ